MKSAKFKSKYSKKYNTYDYFIINDRKEVIEVMENMNANRKSGGRKKVSTYDFSTLYTSLPHEKLKFNMKEFVRFSSTQVKRLLIRQKIVLIYRRTDRTEQMHPSYLTSRAYQSY